MNYTDSQIIEELKINNPCIYQHLRIKIYPWCRNLVILSKGDERDAEELFDDTYLLIKSKIDLGLYSITGAAKFTTFFIEIFKNLYKNKCRAEKSRNADKVAAEIETFASRMPLPDIILEEKDTLRMLDLYVSVLHETCQHYIHLHFDLEYGYEVMRDIVNATIDSIKRELSDNIHELRLHF
jgi:DNA-directed RNA polymerase specialized sigma24 family protein